MPKYTWECDGCKQPQIIDRKVSEMEQGPEAPCPLCGNDKYTRIIVAGGSFILQGGGWYNKGGY